MDASFTKVLSITTSLSYVPLFQRVPYEFQWCVPIFMCACAWSPSHVQAQSIPHALQQEQNELQAYGACSFVQKGHKKRKGKDVEEMTKNDGKEFIMNLWILSKLDNCIIFISFLWEKWEPFGCFAQPSALLLSAKKTIWWWPLIQTFNTLFWWLSAFIILTTPVS